MSPKRKSENNRVEILVVEDSLTQAEQLKYILEMEGYQVSVAHNGKEALALISKSRPAVVISDIVMPEMDGYQLCRQIKADKDLKAIPVILLTALSDSSDVVKALECGADNFITKPYDEKYLLSRIQYFLINQELRRTESIHMGLEIFFLGQKFLINSDRMQILNLLISTYEAAVQKNNELIKAQDDLRALNEQLEEKVEQRTAALTAEITERKRAEEALRSSAQEWRATFDAVNDSVALMDLERRIRRCNKAMVDLLGKPFSEIIGHNCCEVMHGVSEPIKGCPVVRMQETRRRETLVLSMGKRWFNIVADPFLDENGSLIGAVHVISDITEQKLMEESLRESEKKYRDLVDNALVGIYKTNLKGDILFTNEALARIFEFGSPEEVMSVDILSRYKNSKDREVLIETLKKEGNVNNYELEMITKSGKPINVLLSATFDGSFLSGMMMDITQRKQAEEELKLSEQRYRNLIDTARDVIFTLSIDGTISSLNPAFEALTGWSRSEWVGKSFVPLVHPSDISLAQEMFRGALQGETTSIFELHILTKQSKYIVGEFIAVPQFESGQVVGVLGIARDITQRKRAEEALKESEEYLMNLFDSIRAGIIIIDTETHKIIDVNSFALETIGVSKEQILNRVCHKYICPAELGKCPITDLKQNVDSSERVLIKDNSERIPILKSVVPVIREGRKYLIESFINITEHKRAEEEKVVLQEQLRQSQKIEAIGQLAGGVAHDFNNLLTVIKGYSQLSLMELKEGDPLKPNIEEVQKAAERAAGLTRQLLAFSRRQVMEMRVLDPNTLLRDLDKMLRRIIGEDIELVTLLADDLGTVKADAGQIEQVVMNLAVNARDAMQKGGKLTIETANVELDENYARNHVAVKSGPYVMLSVSDTGVGMTPEIRDRVFEPFFTTKEKGKGTGLGLSTVYGIVKQSGGNIWVYSEPGKGTTFKIYLTRVDEPPEEVGQKGVKEGLPRGSETVLVVEDEEEVRKLAVQILRRQGYTVLEASQGNEASHICEQHKGPIHLMVMDVVMPGMNGRELAKSLEPHHPEMQVLYMSGYTDNAIVHHGLLEKGLNFLQKPFTLEGLLRKVREVLDK